MDTVFFFNSNLATEKIHQFYGHFLKSTILPKNR